jgi:hypothetical protein
MVKQPVLSAVALRMWWTMSRRVQELRGKGTSAVASRYQATAVFTEKSLCAVV